MNGLRAQLTVLCGGGLRSDFHKDFLEIICVWGKNYKPCRKHARKTIAKTHQGSHFRLIPFIKKKSVYTGNSLSRLEWIMLRKQVYIFWFSLKKKKKRKEGNLTCDDHYNLYYPEHRKDMPFC